MEATSDAISHARMRVVSLAVLANLTYMRGSTEGCWCERSAVSHTVTYVTGLAILGAQLLLALDCHLRFSSNMASSSRAPIPRQAKAHASYYEPPVWTPGRSLKGSLGYAADNLNLQSYSRSASQWAWGMALRVFHSTKRGKHRRWAAVQPQMVGSDLHLFELTATCVKEVASRCRPLIQRSSSDEPMTLELRGERCLSIMMEYEGFRKAGVGRTDALLQ